ATPTVVDVRGDGHLAAILGVVIAVGEAVGAISHGANTAVALRAAVGRHADVGARAAILRITVRGDFAAVSHHRVAVEKARLAGGDGARARLADSGAVW